MMLPVHRDWTSAVLQTNPRSLNTHTYTHTHPLDAQDASSFHPFPLSRWPSRPSTARCSCAVSADSTRRLHPAYPLLALLPRYSSGGFASRFLALRCIQSTRKFLPRILLTKTNKKNSLVRIWYCESVIIYPVSWWQLFSSTITVTLLSISGSISSSQILQTDIPNQSHCSAFFMHYFI